MTDDATTDDDAVRVWLAERTYSDDEQNLVVLVYATLDGERYLRKERALTGVHDRRPTYAALDVDPSSLAPTPDAERERYARSATDTAAQYDPDGEI